MLIPLMGLKNITFSINFLLLLLPIFIIRPFFSELMRERPDRQTEREGEILLDTYCANKQNI